ncbi:translation initiation factor [Alcaligenes pakistanensis]|uniref:Translation initiation factor n=1 Tax=Alcaligenes pakistanensis TaxID=1482717 RepID=A0A8H9IK25_9BURK|nr:translation initiation factor [Alcaligenes pakistanensis]GHC39116.1 translation initiation factor [Alcaligenes pakistanensis]HCA18568.1 translation initiation factor [Alcaligenes faecalis]
MASLSDQLSRLVYSTDQGRMCPDCGQPQNQCCCEETRRQEQLAQVQGPVRLSLETKGRKGKGVTVISGLVMPEDQLKALIKELKNACGAGGTLKEGTLEIQGDHRAVVQARLEHNGLTVKRVGRP